MELVVEITELPAGAAGHGPTVTAGEPGPEAQWLLAADAIAGASDDALVRAALSEQKEAFNELIRRYARMTLWHVTALVSPPVDPEEVVQEAIVRSYVNLAKLWPPKAFPRWLLGIAKNVALESARASARMPEPALAPAEQVEPHEELQGREMRDRVMAATAALPDHYRVVLALKYMQGRSVDEIAERLQMTPGSVRSRLSRAYGLLRKRLEAGPVPEMPPAGEEDNDAL